MSSHGLFSVHGNGEIARCLKDTSLLDKGPILLTSFKLNYLLEDLNSNLRGHYFKKRKRKQIKIRGHNLVHNTVSNSHLKLNTSKTKFLIPNIDPPTAFLISENENSHLLVENKSLGDIFDFFLVFLYPLPIYQQILLPLPLDYILYPTTSQSLTVSTVSNYHLFLPEL